MSNAPVFTLAMAAPADADRTLAALAREVYALASDLKAFGPEAERVLATQGGSAAAAADVLRNVQALRARLAEARGPWLDAQRARLGLPADARGLKLHLGSGGHALPGWVNLDVHPAPLCWNVHWGLPFADGAATHVFVSHLLEHLFFPHEAGAFLAELRRVLAPGGRVRIIVPDVAQLIDAYHRGDRDFFARRARHWAGARGDGPLLAQFLQYAGAGPDPGWLFEAHKFGYDADTLAELLRLAGFEGVERSGWMASTDPALRVDDQSAVAGAEHGGGHYSLFMEAVVPGIAARPPSPATGMPATSSPDAERASRMQAAREAMAAGRPADAVRHLAEARRLDPSNAQVARSHGVALAAAGELDAAEAALREALALDPTLSTAQLHLGRLRERRGDRRGAVSQYLRAITGAQSRGLWLDETTTPPHLQHDVLHAMAEVREHRVPLLMGLVEPWESRHGRDAMRRLRAMLEHWLGVAAHPPEDPRQAPTFLYVPGLPVRGWHDRGDFPWFERLESQWQDLRAEAEALLAGRGTLQPFLDAPDGVSLDPYLGGGRDARWDAFFFHRHGEAFPDNAALAPRTAHAVQATPLVRIREHAPEICFSILAPGTHIKPHHGVTNARLVAHLPLIVPDDCVLTVGGEARAWEEGRMWAFDDTWLHEAWNRSDRTRVILLMDTWHPGLSEAEREAFSAIVEGIGDFHRG